MQIDLEELREIAEEAGAKGQAWLQLRKALKFGTGKEPYAPRSGPMKEWWEKASDEDRRQYLLRRAWKFAERTWWRRYMCGERLRLLRETLGLSTPQLAALLGVSTFTANAWMSGAQMPRPEYIRKIRALAVSAWGPEGLAAPEVLEEGRRAAGKAR